MVSEPLGILWTRLFFDMTCCSFNVCVTIPREAMGWILSVNSHVQAIEGDEQKCMKVYMGILRIALYACGHFHRL
jgi:hypothetical protein